MKALEKVIVSKFDSETIDTGKRLSSAGTYILLIRVTEGQIITVGGLHALAFPRGYYAYVGSAMAGFKSRLSHHLGEHKKPRWHIDYLLRRASISSIILCETNERIECTVAQVLGRRFDSISAFGSSDCRCRSHLLFSTDEEQMKSAVMTITNLLGY